MKTTVYTLIIAGFGFLAAASSADDKTIKSKSEAIQILPEGVIKARRSAMMMSGANMAAIKAAIDRKDDPRTIAFAATSITAWANALPGMFPVGSNVAPSKARAELWSDRAGFEAAAKQFAEDAALLRDFARAGDTPNLESQWTKLRANCAGCHDKFKVAS
jgi:cytochrome c556